MYESMFRLIRSAVFGVLKIFYDWKERREKEVRDRKFLVDYFASSGLDIRI